MGKKSRKLTVVLVLLLALTFFVTGSGFAISSNGNSYYNYSSIHNGLNFQRIATFPVYRNTDVNLETVAEIVTSSPNGQYLVYTDAKTKNIGFVDIRNPENPQPAGVVAVAGEPTSVEMSGNYVLAVVNTSADYVNTSGLLQVINLRTHEIVRNIELGGQPDSIAVSPDGRYAAIVIENERDEDLGDGRPPQSPPGFLVIVDLLGPPDWWKTRKVDLVGIPDLYPDDPEPEFVDINSENIAAVTLQENNHMALVDLREGKVIRDWSMGSVDLVDIDTNENDLIELVDSLSGVVREPDAVTWITDHILATANEGDLDGGSRGFSIFRRNGAVMYDAGNSFEHLMVRIGHYPESRSENKGSEPEGMEFGRYDGQDLLFVGSERSSVAAVYELKYGATKLEYLQVLPGGVGPEGLHAIPSRGLFVTASEDDSRDDKYRSVITIYKRVKGDPTYPTVESVDRPDGTPIPWAALSALAADPDDPYKAYTAYDSYYKQSRIFELDLAGFPALITDEIVLRDGGGTVDLDVEGVAVRAEGGFWVVSEGAGSVDDPSRPVTSRDLLFKVDPDGSIVQTIQLPDSVNGLQRRFGFEGVAEDGQFVFVAFQREWIGDPDGKVRIGRYDTETGEWTFYYYPLDAPTSPNGGWVGLSEITPLGNNTFAVIERDNQAGDDARIKKIYTFSTQGLEPQPQGGVFPLVTKTLARNLIPDLKGGHGPVLEKVEGFMVTADGDAYIVTDNDGVDDSSGETQMINLGPIFQWPDKE